MEFFFNPRGVAVIGASPRAGKGGNIIVSNLQKGYQGNIYPVNPRYDEINGLKAYPSVLDVPDPVDLAIVYVGADKVPSTLEDCAKRGIRGAMLESAGFSETGNNGKRLQAEAAAVARKTGIRLWGPNCMGLVDAVNRNVFSTVDPAIWSAGMVPGTVSLIAQSGMLAGAFLIDIMTHGATGISKVCSIGNKMDIHEGDLLEYLMDDPHTRVIGLYVESISDGPGFVNICRRCPKPIVVLKGGKSPKGAKAALSHTASLAGDDAVVSGVLAQAGVVEARDFYQMMDICKTLAAVADLPESFGNRVAVMTYSGGAGIVSTDFLEPQGLELAVLSKKTLDTLAKVFPPWMPPANPMDLWPGIIVNGAVTVFNEAVKAACEDPGVDGLFVHCYAGGFSLDPDLYCMATLAREAGKPIVIWISGEREAVLTFQTEARKLEVPAFREVYRGVECLGLALSFLQPSKPIACLSGVENVETEPVSDLEWPDTAGSLDEYRAKRILKAAGIRVVDEQLASSGEEAVAAASSLGFPVVMKGLAQGMIHKTEAGLVRLGVSSEAQLRQAFSELDHAMAGQGQVLVQVQVSGGLELILGLVRDPQFGPCVMLGLGGILTEVLRDRVFAMAPVSMEDALALIGRLAHQNLLDGFRGAEPVDRDALARALVRLSRIGVENPRVREIDINPMIVSQGQPVAVDASIILDA